MSDVKRILLIRHGEVTEEFQGRYIGHADAPLSEEGHATCRMLRERVAELTPMKFYCSPLRRAVETLEEIGGEQSETTFDPRLREINFGKWEKLTFDEICNLPETTPEQIRLWAEELEEFKFPSGESYLEFTQRVDSFFRELLNDPDPVVAVVTHGGVLMRIISLWKQTPVNRQQENLPPRGTLQVYDWNKGVAHHVE